MDRPTCGTRFSYPRKLRLSENRHRTRLLHPKVTRVVTFGTLRHPFQSWMLQFFPYFSKFFFFFLRIQLLTLTSPCVNVTHWSPLLHCSLIDWAHILTLVNDSLRQEFTLPPLVVSCWPSIHWKAIISRTKQKVVNLNVLLLYSIPCLNNH